MISTTCYIVSVGLALRRGELPLSSILTQSVDGHDDGVFMRVKNLAVNGESIRFPDSSTGAGLTQLACV